MSANIWMKRLVRITKKHIKSMVSNKYEDNIFRHTSALAGLVFLGSNFDDQLSLSACGYTLKHTKAAVDEDEQIMLQDLH